MITTAILQTLFNCTGSPLAESVLRSEVLLALGKCGDREFRDATARIRQGGWATSTEDPLTGDTLWSITKKGSQRIDPSMGRRITGGR